MDLKRGRGRAVKRTPGSGGGGLRQGGAMMARAADGRRCEGATEPVNSTRRRLRRRAALAQSVRATHS